MKIRIAVNLLSVIFFTFLLFASFPVMAQEPLRGIQLALKGVSADDAESAVDDESPKSSKQEGKAQGTNVQAKSVEPQVKEQKTNSQPQSVEPPAKEQKTNSQPQSIEQEVNELKQEIKKIRSENEARKRLEVPEEEKSKSVDDILSAVGREYSLLKKGTIGLSYSFSYSYYSGDVIDESARVERRANHNLTNTINAEYALLNNITFSVGIPFAYKYNRVGTSSSQEATDLADISLGLTWQPFASAKFPTTILSFGVSVPTGSSPYHINLNESLATGSGTYGINGGVSLSKVIDPLVAFGNLSLSYGLPTGGLDQHWGASGRLTKVDPGSSIGLAIGFGYALSYQASMNLSAQFSYSFSSKYTLNDTRTEEAGSSLSSSFNIGTGWRVTPARSLYVSLGIGLTNNDPDVSLSFKLPYEF
jgi:hypothetical protein